MFITSMSTETSTPQRLPHLKIQAMWSTRYLSIFIDRIRLRPTHHILASVLQW